MEWTQALFIVFGNLAVILPIWLWMRSENRADLRNMDAKFEMHRTEITAIVQGMRDEMKDFHYRLLEIERNRK